MNYTETGPELEGARLSNFGNIQSENVIKWWFYIYITTFRVKFIIYPWLIWTFSALSFSYEFRGNDVVLKPAQALSSIKIVKDDYEKLHSCMKGLASWEVIILSLVWELFLNPRNVFQDYENF